jgi:hypothetical protein
MDVLQTIWDWIVFLYVQEIFIPAIEHPIQTYLAIFLLSATVSFWGWLSGQPR